MEYTRSRVSALVNAVAVAAYKHRPAHTPPISRMGRENAMKPHQVSSGWGDLRGDAPQEVGGG